MQNVLPLPWKRDSARFGAGAPVVETVVAEPEAPDVAPASIGASTRVALDAPRRMSVQAVELGPLASLAVRCAIVVGAVGAAAVTFLWIVAAALGLVGSAESFMQSVGFRNFTLSGTKIIAGASLAVTGCALGVAALIVVAGAVYNFLASNGGGLRLQVAAASDLDVTPGFGAPESAMQARLGDQGVDTAHAPGGDAA